MQSLFHQSELGRLELGPSSREGGSYRWTPILMLRVQPGACTRITYTFELTSSPLKFVPSHVVAYTCVATTSASHSVVTYSPALLKTKICRRPPVDRRQLTVAGFPPAKI